jgi:hypothetical protein
LVATAATHAEYVSLDAAGIQGVAASAWRTAPTISSSLGKPR